MRLAERTNERRCARNINGEGYIAVNGSSVEVSLEVIEVTGINIHLGGNLLVLWLLHSALAIARSSVWINRGGDAADRAGRARA